MTTTLNEQEILERISAARTYLTAKVPFLGFLTLRMKPRITNEHDECKTAGVGPDGTLVLNPEFISKQSDPELRGLLAHEVLHPALEFFTRLGTRDIRVFNCFPGGTLVSGSYVAIETLQEGSSMLTRSGVAPASESLHTRQYTGPLYTVRGLGLEEFSCTPEHPVLVYTRLNPSRYPIRLSSEPEWVKTEDLHPKKHYLCVPRVRGTTGVEALDLRPYTGHSHWGEGDLAHRRVLDELPLDENTAWLMGLYVAEGDANGHAVRWTLHSEEVDLAGRIERVGNSLGYAVCRQGLEDRKGQRLSIGSPILMRFFAASFGTGSTNKRIPDFILYHKNENILRAFVSGYQDGDGWNTQGAKGAGTACRVLALQMQLLWARLGKLAKVKMRPQKDRTIRSTFVPGGAPFWWIAIHDGKVTTRTMPWGVMSTHSESWKVTDEFILTPVKSVKTRLFEGPVHNIATPDHTYTVSNAIVHNCAHDFVINLIIRDFIAGKLEDSIKLPAGGLLDQKYSGMSAEEVYESFPKLTKQQMQALLNNLLSGDCRPGVNSGKDGKAAGEGDEAANGRLQEDWKIAVVAAAEVHERTKGRGTLPAGLRILIDEMLSPKVHWSTIISRWLGENAGNPDLTYQRPSKRSESVGEILIGRRRKSYPDVTILWDTSGSMSGEEKKIFPEVASICTDLDLTLRVIIIDAAIHADLTDVKEAEEIAANVKGGGGSDFCPAFERLDEERNDSVVIAFTDGAIGVPATMPESLKGVIWVLTCDYRDPTGGKWGQVLRLDKEQNGSWE